ncbi:DUF1462 family protein [Salinicoccus sp. Marseille-QA3877]
MKYVVNVYGRKVPSAGDPVMPDYRAVCKQLQHTFQNKFPEDDFYCNHIDMDTVDNLTDHDENLIEQIDNDDLSSPLITINDEIVSHGDIKVEYILRWLEKKR